jgi:hypothetical protein
VFRDVSYGALVAVLLLAIAVLLLALGVGRGWVMIAGIAAVVSAILSLRETPRSPRH